MFKLTCVCKVWQEEPVGWRRWRQHEDNETTAHISGHREGITKLRVGKRNAGCWLGRRGGWKLGCGCASCVSFFIRLNFADACALAVDCHHSSFPDNDILKPNKNTSCMNLTGIHLHHSWPLLVGNLNTIISRILHGIRYHIQNMSVSIYRVPTQPHTTGLKIRSCGNYILGMGVA